MTDLKMEMETKSFNKAIKKFMKKSDIGADKVLRKVAFDLLANILRPEPKGRHPVDTGRARAGWYASMVGLGNKFDLSKGIKSDSQVEQGKKEGSFVDKTKSKWNKYIELVNAVSYIMFLEYGHSQAAPAGMVRISMRKMRGALPKAMSKEFRTEWNKIFF